MMQIDASETTIWTLSRDRKTVRMALPPLPLPGMPEPIMLLMDIKAQTVDAMIERLTILRSQMLPALPAPGKRTRSWSSGAAANWSRTPDHRLA